MSNADVAEASADTVWLVDDHPTAPRSLSNWAVASVLVGALSAFAALGVIVTQYYVNPDFPDSRCGPSDSEASGIALALS